MNDSSIKAPDPAQIRSQTEPLHDWLERMQPLRQSLIEQAITDYRQALTSSAAGGSQPGKAPPPKSQRYSDSKPPQSIHLTAHSALLHDRLRRGLSLDRLASQLPQPIDSERARAALQLRWSATLPEPPTPQPLLSLRLAPTRLAIVTGAAAALGALLLGLLAHTLLELRYLGMVVGSAIAAGGSLLILTAWAESTTLRRTLAGAIGVAAVAELGAVAASRLNPAALWRALSGRALFSRLRLYLLATLLFIFLRPTPQIDFEATERLLRAQLAGWIDGALLRLYPLATAAERPTSSLDPALARAIVELAEQLPRGDRDRLEESAEALLREARRLGLDGLDRKPTTQAESSETMIWDGSDTIRFDTFGVIEPGDRVQVVASPVTQGGRVLVKGQVRKLRR